VTTLGQQTGSRDGLICIAISPVSSDVGVTEVPEAHRLGMFKRQDITNHVHLADEISQKHVVRAVSKHMAYSKDGFWPCLDGVLDLEAVVQTIRKWLLTKDMDTKRTNCSCHFFMLMIQYTNKDTVDLWRCHTASCLVGSSLLLILQEISPVCEFLANLRSRRLPDIPIAKLSAFEGDGICYCCDDAEARVPESSRVRISSRTGSDDEETRQLMGVRLSLSVEEWSHRGMGLETLWKEDRRRAARKLRDIAVSAISAACRAPIGGWGWPHRPVPKPRVSNSAISQCHEILMDQPLY
jgi:hypothetical protein